jgi:endoglucanase
MRLIAASLLACTLLPAVVASANAAASCPAWPAWERFKQHHLTADGRVIDHDTPRLVTVSEGQAYALFFALVAGDRSTFEHLLQWTQNNLAHGDLAASLPAWSWGRRDDGGWGILDSNAAADADLWIAYALSEAGRLWRLPRYSDIGKSMAQRILREEMAQIPGLGPSLLPGPRGFVHDAGWRLNPSYTPLQVLRGMQKSTGEAIWGEIAKTSARIIADASPHGFAPDWVLYREGSGFLADPETNGSGSYDAIRVYLWAGTLSTADPLRAALLRALQPMAAATASLGAPPESVDTRSASVRGTGPEGFSAALVPLLATTQYGEAARVQRLRVEQWQSNAEHRAYFGESLMLFGLGWHENRYRFDANGSLIMTAAMRRCAYAS